MKSGMKKFVSLTAVIAAFGFVGAASAADMPVKAPIAPVVAAYNWTGLYVDLGLGWQSSHIDWVYTNFAPAQNPFSLSRASGSIAGHIGYQHQFGWLVVGGEVGAFSSLGKNWATVTAPGAVSGPCANVAGVQCQASVGRAFLVGGKLGGAWGNWLFYGVGGVVLNTKIATNILPGTSGLVFTDAGSPDRTRGWYWGGGIDYMLLKTRTFDLIGGVEYMRVQLNTVTECSVGAGLVTGCPGTPAAAARLVSAKQDVVWVKLTAKFNPFAH